MLERIWSKEDILPLLVVNLYRHYGNQYGGSSKNCELIYLKTQLYHSWAYTLSYQEDTWSTKIIAALFIIARNWKQPMCWIDMRGSPHLTANRNFSPAHQFPNVQSEAYINYKCLTDGWGLLLANSYIKINPYFLSMPCHVVYRCYLSCTCHTSSTAGWHLPRLCLSSLVSLLRFPTCL